ncbi:hypothetical protein PIB30_049162 [Stylosanthes scabra]|uniref:Uncharacterized protein n=1 Tax=Stylosanthes scabra TaxID=79078 RepID=A0ABU6QHZ2_9FABA|nr:hypothetical protein [Stylosanthes scabra]
MSKVEEESKAQAVELQSCRSALVQEKKKVESLTQSLEEKQTALGKAEAASDHWCQEWKNLAAETEEIVQETFEILMDQVHHLSPVVDFSTITLDTRWDLKGRRIYNPNTDLKEQQETAAEEQTLYLLNNFVGYVSGSRNLGAFYGVELVGALFECFDHPIGAFPICS